MDLPPRLPIFLRLAADLGLFVLGGRFLESLHHILVDEHPGGILVGAGGRGVDADQGQVRLAAPSLRKAEHGAPIGGRSTRPCPIGSRLTGAGPVALRVAGFIRAPWLVAYRKDRADRVQCDPAVQCESVASSSSRAETPTLR
ncbi:hypothetical protein GCM10010252_28090 [Streptomyces aureoverticillatus]|nr:hypothetical protein GCM10010252_28090 [Streptomyces aureoverticillatus]